MAVARFIGGPLDGLVYPPSLDPSASLPATIVVTAAGAYMNIKAPPVASKVGQADLPHLMVPAGVSIVATTYTLTTGNYV